MVAAPYCPLYQPSALFVGPRKVRPARETWDVKTRPATNMDNLAYGFMNRRLCVKRLGAWSFGLCDHEEQDGPKEQHECEHGNQPDGHALVELGHADTVGVSEPRLKPQIEGD